jgi:glycolate oxidase subunit GlcD
VVIDTTLMRRVLRVDSENYYAVVEPGLVNLDLTRSVEPEGLCFAPDPPSRSACTLAGNVAENASGPHGFKYGVTTAHILGLEVVLPDGNVVRLGGPQAEAPSYDLTGLFVGTEGTMGVITEVTVRLLPRPQAARTYLAAFAELAQACRAALDITRHGIIPAALEILDKNAIEALEASAHAAGTPPHAAAVLLVEIDGLETALEEEEVRIRRVLEANQALEIRRARDPSESERLWDGHKRVFGAMGKIRADLYVLEGVVPRSRMEAGLGRIHEIAAKHDIFLSSVIHAGDGRLHSCIAYDGRDPGETKRALAAGREILAACFETAGSISGDREVANEEMELMPRVLTERDLELQAAIRGTVDPREICNRGKAFPGSRPSVKARDALEERSSP